MCNLINKSRLINNRFSKNNILYMNIYNSFNLKFLFNLLNFDGFKYI